MYLAQLAARQAMLERIQPHATAVREPSASARRRRVAGIVLTALLIGGGLLAWGVLDLHPPTSLEALLPRL